jgi:hypothetical protein
VSARGKAAAVVTSAGILAAAWSAATLGGQTAIGASAVAADPTSLTTDNPSASVAGRTPRGDDNCGDQCVGDDEGDDGRGNQEGGNHCRCRDGKGHDRCPGERIEGRHVRRSRGDAPVRIGGGLHHGLRRQDHQRVGDHHQRRLEVDVDHQLSRIDT